MDSVKNISIISFLAGRGITPQMERGGYGMYLSPLREERTPSFKVDYGQNLWYDHGIGEGGSIIDLVSRIEGCTIGEAIRRLEGGTSGGGLPETSAGSLSFHGNMSAHIDRAQRTEPERPRIEIVTIGDLKHPALVEYLRERGIDMAAARKYCNEVRYSTGGREYFTVGFRNDAGGWELRNRSFKGSSTPKNITTLNNGSDTVMVFEGFIDFLSYLSLKQNYSPTIDTAVLNSVANLRRAIPFLESHRTVHAFLDNDEAGRKTLAEMRELLPCSEVVDQSPFYRNHKDLNDYWREKAHSTNRVDNRDEETNADTVKREVSIERTTATDTIKRQTPTITTPAADRFKRSVTVRKQGGGMKR